MFTVIFLLRMSPRICGDSFGKGIICKGRDRGLRISMGFLLLEVYLLPVMGAGEWKAGFTQEDQG